MNASGSGSRVRISPPLNLSSACRMIVTQSTLEVIKNSLRNEGPMFIFKGWVPAWVRLQPTTILIFVTLEQLKNVVDWTRELRAKKA